MSDSSRGFALHHGGVNYLLVLCVCKLCLDKVGMWLKKSSLVKSGISLSLGILETFSSPIDEDVLVILLRSSLSSVLGFRN